MTIRAEAQPCLPDDPDAFDLLATTARATILKDSAGEEAAIDSGRTLIRLSLACGTLLDGPVRLRYLLDGRCQLHRRLLALRQFEALMRLGRVPRPLHTPVGNVPRRTLLIRTLDALAADSSPRSIAIKLFGGAEVFRNWNHESDYLRMKTRRLVNRARYLANGGYLEMLS